MLDGVFEQLLPVSANQVPSAASHFLLESLSDEQFVATRFLDGVRSLTDSSMNSSSSSSMVVGLDNESLLVASASYSANPNWATAQNGLDVDSTHESPMAPPPLLQPSTLMHDAHAQGRWLDNLPLEFGAQMDLDSPFATSPSISPTASSSTAAVATPTTPASQLLAVLEYGTSSDLQPLAQQQQQDAETPGSRMRGRKRQALPPDPKRAAQMAKNRQAAERCRRKKRAYVEELEARAREAAQRHRLLKAQVEQLERVVLALKEEMVCHNGCADGRIRDYLLSGVQRRMGGDARRGLRAGGGGGGGGGGDI